MELAFCHCIVLSCVNFVEWQNVLIGPTSLTGIIWLFEVVKLNRL